jgi:hypothetical protein
MLDFWTVYLVVMPAVAIAFAVAFGWGVPRFIDWLERWEARREP